ncbi:MAG: hypothetical protein ABI042_02520 [Verrucomicrobiota bacterium]
MKLTKKLKPLLRISAAMWLVVWVAAVAICSAEPLIGHSHSEISQGAVHVETHHDNDSHQDNNSSRESHDDPFCHALKTVSSTSHSAILVKPDFGVIASLNFLWLSQASTFVQPEIQNLRQSPDRVPIYTQEVYLGSAFFSHAPPLIV